MSFKPQSSAAGRLLGEAPPAFFSPLIGARHGFFGRRGGVSSGIYASLNAGRGSKDDAAHVAANRARIAAGMGVALDKLAGLYQVHSAKAVRIDANLSSAGVEADAMVTTEPGIALSILTADCAPILFHDAKAGVIGAAHAGWKGALGGVIEAALDEMVRAGARLPDISCAIGPTIQQASYEVGPEFRDRFLADDSANVFYFAPGAGDRYQFNLPGYCAHRLREHGVSKIGVLPNDTCAEAEDFFSNRRAVLRSEGDYGRNCAAIVLA
ncbi:MAG: peptidoglycan editing factor PgeF [Caulobacterales bacterium]